IYMLPVIMGLVVLFVKEGKWRALTAAYAYLFLVNFYTAYMVGFFSLFLLLALMWAEYGKSWKQYIIPGFRFAGLVILAALMGAVFLVPAAYALLIAGAPDTTGFSALRLTLWDLYGNLFLGQMQTLEGIFPMIYCGIAAVYLVPLFFMDRRTGKKAKAVGAVLLAILILCSLWLPGYMFLHCFDAPDVNGYRFGFLFSFLLASVGCAQWNRTGNVSSKKLVIIAALNIVIYYLVYLWQGQSLEAEYQSASILGWEINILFLVLFCALMCYAGRGEGTGRKAEKLLVVLMASELIVNGFFCITRAGYLPGDYQVIYNNWMESAEETIRAVRQEDDGFYRISYQNAVAQDQSAQFDYMDVPYFCSVENWRLRETLGLLGYSISPRNVFNTGGTPVTEMLFAQRYIVMAKNPWEMDTAVQAFYKNETALELGYMVSEGFQEISLQDNAMENLNLVLQGMTGKEIVCMIPYTGDIRLESENMVFGITAENTYALYREDETEASARLIYRIETDPFTMPYAYFSQERSVRDTSMPILYGGDGKGAYLTSPGILQMERGEDGDSISIVMVEETSSEAWYQNHYFSYYDAAALQEAYEALKEHQLVIRERRGSRLRGTVEVPEDKTLLFTSIPYDKGWRIYVDGMEAEPVALLNGAFLGTELTPGTHEIEMFYQNRLNTVSVWISIVACVVFLVAAIWKKEEGKNMN
ncbi:MAG: YfhO family protein, partial [Lachnospiraceae bacterium]|nr:YfhO family protein [Lachnospiraceae bacterium]